MDLAPRAIAGASSAHVSTVGGIGRADEFTRWPQKKHTLIPLKSVINGVMAFFWRDVTFIYIKLEFCFLLFFIIFVKMVKT